MQDFDGLFLALTLHYDGACEEVCRKRGGGGGSAFCMLKTCWGRREGLQQKRAAAFEDPRRKDLRALLKMLKLRLVIVQHGMSFETGKL